MAEMIDLLSQCRPYIEPHGDADSRRLLREIDAALAADKKARTEPVGIMSGGETRYPEREIFAYGRYIQCQIMNWQKGPPPQYLVCNPLDASRREPFLAKQGMGTWMRVDEYELARLIASLHPRASQSPSHQKRDSIDSEFVEEGHDVV